LSAFAEFGKIPRLSRNCVITEKIDGTNAQVFIERMILAPGDLRRTDSGGLCVFSERSQAFYSVEAGSRSRWVTPEADNFGFASWVHAHGRQLVEGLGEGRHFGEWWGSGIQRGYGLQRGEKRFSLFNVARWADDRDREKFPLDRPACCGVVPVLYAGLFRTEEVTRALGALIMDGSHASPGFDRPEGVIVYHEAAQSYFKKTLEKDEEPKGKLA
jgi:hypothetical protein